MSKKVIPLLNIQQSCDDRKVRNFKATLFDELACAATEFEESHRHEYFEIIWLRNGEGVHQIDLHDHPYHGSVMFILAPGQIHKIEQQKPSGGYVIKFLPSIFKNEKDFSDYVLDTCLFDSISSCPGIKIPEELDSILENLFLRLIDEFTHPDIDSENIVSSYLKILITQINRIKRSRYEDPVVNNAQYSLFRTFKIAVEKHYNTQHSVQFYADLLATQARTLNAVSRRYIEKSAGKIIQDRILLEAKRSLYYETKTIKEICFSLGFEDPAYFTRFFKKRTGLSPQQFKDRKTAVV